MPDKTRTCLDLSLTPCGKVAIPHSHVDVCAAGVAVLTVDSVGRRPLLLAGIAGLTIALCALSAAQLLAVGQAATWTSVIALLLYVGCYQVGIFCKVNPFVPFVATSTTYDQDCGTKPHVTPRTAYGLVMDYVVGHIDKHPSVLTVCFLESSKLYWPPHWELGPGRAALGQSAGSL